MMSNPALHIVIYHSLTVWRFPPIKHQSSERTLRLSCTHDQHRIIAKHLTLREVHSHITVVAVAVVAC